MALSPPRDLVLDFVKAADPMEVQAAHEKLKANRAAFAATSLAENGKGFSNTVDVLDHIGQKSGLANIQNHGLELPVAFRNFLGLGAVL
ncbi:rod-binding protein, partial [Rhizobium ruizarguesonis]